MYAVCAIAGKGITCAVSQCPSYAQCTVTLVHTDILFNRSDPGKVVQWNITLLQNNY